MLCSLPFPRPEPQISMRRYLRHVSAAPPPAQHVSQEQYCSRALQSARCRDSHVRRLFLPRVGLSGLGRSSGIENMCNNMTSMHPQFLCKGVFVSAVQPLDTCGRWRNRNLLFTVLRKETNFEVSKQQRRIFVAS